MGDTRIQQKGYIDLRIQIKNKSAKKNLRKLKSPEEVREYLLGILEKAELNMGKKEEVDLEEAVATLKRFTDDNELKELRSTLHEEIMGLQDFLGNEEMFGQVIPSDDFVQKCNYIVKHFAKLIEKLKKRMEVLDNTINSYNWGKRAWIVAAIFGFIVVSTALIVIGKPNEVRSTHIQTLMTGIFPGVIVSSNYLIKGGKIKRLAGQMEVMSNMKTTAEVLKNTMQQLLPFLLNWSIVLPIQVGFAISVNFSIIL